MILDASPSDKGRKADWDRRQKEREGGDAQWAQREQEENEEWRRVERGGEERFRRPRRRSVILTLQMQVDGRTDAECLFHLASFDRPTGPTDEQTDNYRGKACWGGKESAGRRETQSLESYVQ